MFKRLLLIIFLIVTPFILVSENFGSRSNLLHEGYLGDYGVFAATKGGNLLNFEQRTLQHTFKHAKDFGITGNWNKTTATEFGNVLKNQVNSVSPIQGTYRGTQQVLHFYDKSTGLNVMTDLNGNLVGGWKLSADQIKYLLTTGALK